MSTNMNRFILYEHFVLNIDPTGIAGLFPAGSPEADNHVSRRTDIEHGQERY
jgi:hypothetical protein